MSNQTEPMEIDFYGEAVQVVAVHSGRYAADDTPVVDLLDPINGEPWGTLTVCCPNSGVVLADNEIAVKTWSENEPYRALLDTPHFADTQKRFQAGFAHVEIWTTTLDLTKEA